MRYALIFAVALVVACGNDRRGNGIVVVGDCVEGSAIACACSDGRTGSQVCIDRKYQTCMCDGVQTDAGSNADSGTNNGFDGGLIDSGVHDAGNTPPRDAGNNPPRDAGPPPPRDAGPPPPRDAGMPPPRDAGPPPTPDAGVPTADGGGVPGEGTPCATDADCNIGLPIPLLICEMNICEIGCLFSQVCPVGTTCDIFTGRCL